MRRGRSSSPTACDKVYYVGEVDVHALRGVDLPLSKGEFSVRRDLCGSGVRSWGLHSILAVAVDVSQQAVLEAQVLFGLEEGRPMIVHPSD